MHLKKDSVGMFIHMDNTTVHYDIKHNAVINDGENSKYTAAGSENLGDATFALLKIGDVVVYKEWKESKAGEGKTIYKHGIVT